MGYVQCFCDDEVANGEQLNKEYGPNGEQICLEYIHQIFPTFIFANGITVVIIAVNFILK